MISVPCKGCGADLGYDQWPWGDPFLPSRPYFWDGAAWCKTCHDKIMVYNMGVIWGLPGASILPRSLDSPVTQAAT